MNLAAKAVVTLQRMSRLDSRGAEILQLLFGESRTPVPQERDYLESWIRLGFSDELLLLARDRTLFNLQEFKWSYMNSILNRWHKEGLTTPAAVEATERGRRPVYQKPQARPSAGPSPAPSGASPVASSDVDRMFQELARAAQPPGIPGKEP